VPEHDGWPAGAAGHRGGGNETGETGRDAGDGDRRRGEPAAAGARDQMEGACSSLRRELRELERVMARERHPPAGEAPPGAPPPSSPG
jgi:hypothetical protein